MGYAFEGLRAGCKALGSPLQRLTNMRMTSTKPEYECRSTELEFICSKAMLFRYEMTPRSARHSSVVASDVVLLIQPTTARYSVSEIVKINSREIYSELRDPWPAINYHLRWSITLSSNQHVLMTLLVTPTTCYSSRQGAPSHHHHHHHQSVVAAEKNIRQK